MTVDSTCIGRNGPDTIPRRKAGSEGILFQKLWERNSRGRIEDRPTTMVDFNTPRAEVYSTFDVRDVNKSHSHETRYENCERVSEKEIKV